ncbi:hypothetical protein C8R45DRAFT_1080732 [Mycena sanguinolenta]|nr:hypothetical protein C8R45DRAFT_1080732 [Mycena sanguinolenta]
MRFSALSSLIPLVALGSPTYAFVLMQACNGANGGQPCVNWRGTLPSACYDFVAHGQDKTVSDAGCSGRSVTLTKTAVTLGDVGFDKRASSFKLPSWTENHECLAGNVHGDPRENFLMNAKYTEFEICNVHTVVPNRPEFTNRRSLVPWSISPPSSPPHVPTPTPSLSVVICSSIFCLPSDSIPSVPPPAEAGAPQMHPAPRAPPPHPACALAEAAQNAHVRHLRVVVPAPCAAGYARREERLVLDLAPDAAEYRTSTYTTAVCGESKRRHASGQDDACRRRCAEGGFPKRRDGTHARRSWGGRRRSARKRGRGARAPQKGSGVGNSLRAEAAQGLGQDQAGDVDAGKTPSPPLDSERSPPSFSLSFSYTPSLGDRFNASAKFAVRLLDWPLLAGTWLALAHCQVVPELVLDLEIRTAPFVSIMSQAALAQLVEQGTEIAKHLREHRVILSPVRRVPTELICELFDMATAQSRAVTPWWLGCISATWRQYALAHTRLWTCFSVRGSALDFLVLTLPKLEAQLLRCGTALLDVHWTTVGTSRPNSRILDLLLPRSEAWRSVSFDIRTADAVLDWLAPVRGKLDGLRNLEAQRNLCTFPDIFMTAPNLCQLVLPSIETFSVSPTIYRTSIPIRWEQITDYQDTIIVLPCLRRLCLDRVGFLLQIIASNLEELCSLRSAWLIPRILPFVHQASCTLQRLNLWQCALTSELTITLRDLLSLTYLFLQNGHHDEGDGLAFFATLRVSGTTTDICPRLISMVYGYVYGGWESRTSRDSFMQMARSRFEGNPSGHSATVFTSLRLLSCSRYVERYSPPDVDINARVQSLQAEGFNVAFLGEGETAEYLCCRKF